MIDHGRLSGLGQASNIVRDLPSVCTDCIKHGGDWECDRTHCRKETKQQATKASNCISRQAAIDALYAFWSGSSFDGEGYDIADKSEYVLSELPSAEPEIIRCKECRFAHLTYDGDCKYCDKWIDEFGIPEELYLDGDFFCGYAERRTDE